MLEGQKLEVQSDKLLMVVAGNAFRLPVFVQPVVVPATSKRMWVVTPALQFHHQPRELLWEMLASVSCRIDKYRYALIDDEEKLKMVCIPVVGVTPEWHYVWEAVAPPAKSEIDVSGWEELPLDVTSERFIYEVSHRCRLLTHSQMKVVWNAIVQVAMNWLIVQRKPVSFGFMTVIALPYRVNWKSVLGKAFPKSYQCFSRAEKDIPEALAKSGVIDSLLGAELLEVDGKSHIVGWIPEAIPTKLWDQSSKMMETTRMSVGQAAYAKFIAQSIKRSRKWIVAAYRHFICRAVKPAGCVRRVGTSNDPVIFPSTLNGGIDCKALARSDGTVCLDSTGDYQEPSLFNITAREIDRMSQMPDLQSQTAQLRISGGYVVGPKNGEKG